MMKRTTWKMNMNDKMQAKAMINLRNLPNTFKLFNGPETIFFFIIILKYSYVFCYIFYM
jgi:hypothetical protein